MIISRGLLRAPGLALMLLTFAYCPLALAGNASIGGLVFLDRDCDGIKASTESALPNWKVYLRGVVGGLPPILDSTITSIDGSYSFSSLDGGDYSVAIGQESSYLQSTPSSVDYRLTIGPNDTIGDRDFSVKAVVTCDTTLTHSCQGGIDDNFSGANGPESSSPSVGLRSQMLTCGTALSFFDQPAGSDACFGHTFSNCWGTCGPMTETIQMRIRASSAGSQDDELHFGEWPSPGSIWHIGLSNLLEIHTGGADVSWDPGDSMTVTLDLANLPVADRGLTNIMAALQDGDLDIYVRNNSEVDFARGDGGGG